MKNRHLKLTRDVSLVVCLKALFIVVLWWVCFSHPIDRQLTVHSMQYHLIQ